MPPRPHEAPDATRTAAELLKVGNVLLLSNAQVKMFQGTPRLALDRSGTMQLAAEGTEVEPQARAHRRGKVHALYSSELKHCSPRQQTELNMSLIEYDLVTA